MDPPPVPFKLRPGATSPQGNEASMGVSSRMGMPGTYNWNGHDPFFNAYHRPQHRSSSARISFEDQAMPDYSNSNSSTTTTTTSSRDVSGPLARQSDMDTGYVAPRHDELYEGLVQALSPSTRGTRAPANTRASSAESGARAPPSAAAQARIASYSTHHRKVSIPRHAVGPAKAKPHGRHRDPSDVSMDSRFSDETVGQKDGVGRIHHAPASCIKGKKEGQGSKQAGISLPPLRFTSAERAKGLKKTNGERLGMAGRKRTRKVGSHTDVETESEPIGGLDLPSSPSRKMSKSDGVSFQKTTAVIDLSATSERRPLGRLENAR